MSSFEGKGFSPYPVSRERSCKLRGKMATDSKAGRSSNYFGKLKKKSRIDWYSASSSSADHREYSSKNVETGDSVVKLLPPEKCSLIMYRSYDLNRSGSKKVLIGLDLEDGFQPKLFIAKNGNAGVSISENIWASLMDQQQAITSYFDNEQSSSSVNQTVLSCDNIHINSIKLYGERIIHIVKNNRYCVYLGRESWCGLLDLSKCIQNALEESCEWCVQINSTIMNDIVGNIKLYLSAVCNGCDSEYMSNAHDCVNVDFITQQLGEFVKCYYDVDEADDCEYNQNYNHKFPRKRFLYELYKFNPDMLIQLITKSK